MHNDCADRHFALIKRLNGLIERFLHPEIMRRERIDGEDV
jgi:hypothetical protein